MFNNNNFSKEFKQAIQNKKPCEILYVLIQIKLAIFILSKNGQSNFFTKLTQEIYNLYDAQSFEELIKNRADETKDILKQQIHLFAKDNHLNSDLFDNLDSTFVFVLVKIALTTDNLSINLRHFMDSNPRRTGTNFTPVVIRQLMQSLLIKLTRNQPLTELFDPFSRTGELLFSWPSLPFSNITMYCSIPFEQEIATLFWNLVSLEQQHKSNGRNSIPQTASVTNVNPFQAQVSLFSTAKKYDAILSSVLLATNTLRLSVESHSERVKTHTTASVEIILNSLNKNGKAILLIEDGFFHRTTFDYRFRQQLVNEDLIELVISLPANLYFKNSHLNTSILVINRNKPASTKQTVKLVHLHKLKEFKLNEIEQLSELICKIDDNQLNTPQADLSSNTKIINVTTQQIIDNEFSLRPIDYLQVTQSSDTINLDAEIKKLNLIKQDWTSLEKELSKLFISKTNE